MKYARLLQLGFKTPNTRASHAPSLPPHHTITCDFIGHETIIYDSLILLSHTTQDLLYGFHTHNHYVQQNIILIFFIFYRSQNLMVQISLFSMCFAIF